MASPYPSGSLRMQTRYAIRWSRLTETLALAASAVGLIVVVAGLV